MAQAARRRVEAVRRHLTLLPGGLIGPRTPRPDPGDAVLERYQEADMAERLCLYLQHRDLRPRFSEAEREESGE